MSAIARVSPRTLPPTLHADADTPRRASPPAGDRYEALQVIGRGGMGEIRLVLDRRLARIVAMKTLRRDLPFSRSQDDRLRREALIQARLQHPAIVPVYDIGVAPGGETFFTMKRVRGRALSALLARLRDEAPDGHGVQSTRRRAITAFGTVCLAVAYAHRAGVVHRDLKPDNVMLGDFGEVWVLDWGVAKASYDGVPPPQRGHDRSFVGTPGYMAPEQIRDFEGVDARADVYSLGAVLFEILARAPLHAGHTVDAVLQATLRGADVHLGRRALPDDVPPALEQVCRRATALDPAERYPDARALHAAFDRASR